MNYNIPTAVPPPEIITDCSKSRYDNNYISSYYCINCTYYFNTFYSKLYKT